MLCLFPFIFPQRSMYDAAHHLKLQYFCSDILACVILNIDSAIQVIEVRDFFQIVPVRTIFDLTGKFPQKAMLFVFCLDI